MRSNSKRIILACDIGGSHITSAVIDLQTRTPIYDSHNRFYIDSQACGEEIIERWTQCMKYSMRTCSPDRIHLAVPGPMDYDSGICLIKDQDKYRSLYGQPLAELIAQKLPVPAENIKFFNDAACFLQGELFNGILKEHASGIALTLGTGLGTSHTINGQATDSDLWNLPFKSGIAESYLSTGWFISRFKELSGLQITGVQEMVENYKQSIHTTQVFEEFSDNLARFITVFINRVNCKGGIVLGGNITKSSNLFLEQTNYILQKEAHVFHPIQISKSGEEAILMGAASGVVK